VPNIGSRAAMAAPAGAAHADRRREPRELTVAQHVTERDADALTARAPAGVALVVLAALAGALGPGELPRMLGAALVTLVVCEIRLGLAEQTG
jgi:hypothetical protein